MRFKTVAVFVSLLALVILSLSVYFDAPTTAGLPSYRLTTQKTKDGNVTRVDYVDEAGNITFATDKHYATIVKTYEDGHMVLAQYYDADGEPAVQPLGYCALARHYNEEGLVDVIRYLDAWGEPVTTSAGYNSVHRTYTEGLADTDTYYIDDVQVQHKDGYYGFRRTYNENGQIEELWYLDQDGELTLNKDGYAKIARSYNDDGRITYQYYYDASGAPATLASGYCGVYREYDEFGKITRISYLDAEGNPTNIDKGYAKVEQSYAYDGTVASVRYFNAEGEPVSAGKGQYGVDYTNGVGTYVDEEGEPILRIDTFLNTHPLVVLIAGLALCVAAAVMGRNGKLAFLIAYILFIVVMTVLFREKGNVRYQLEVFWSYGQFLTSRALRQEIIHNIWLFVPLGALLYDPSHPHRWIWAVGLSVLIEVVQLVFGIGLCEFDDVISNGLGAVLGYGFAEEVHYVIQSGKFRPIRSFCNGSGE